MPVRFVEMSRAALDLTKSHIRVERGQNGWFSALGAIGHPDVVEMTNIPPRPFKSRQQAIDSAVELAGFFGIVEVWIVD